MKTLSKIFAAVTPLLLSLNAGASVNITHNQPGYIRWVAMYNWIDCSPWYFTTYGCEHYLNLGESLFFPDTYSDGCFFYYSPTGDVLIPLEPPPDQGGPVFADDVHNHEIVVNATIQPEPKTVSHGRATVKISAELREIKGNDPFPDGDQQTWPPGRGGAFKLDKFPFPADWNSIEIEQVPGQANTYRGLPREIELESIVWYNTDKYVNGKPKLVTMHAEYQHYSEYAKRMDGLAEEINEILSRSRFGTPEQVKKSIRAEIDYAVRQWRAGCDNESARYDSPNTDPNDPDKGTHRQDLDPQRKVRIPGNFVKFPSAVNL